MQQQAGREQQRHGLRQPGASPGGVRETGLQVSAEASWDAGTGARMYLMSWLMVTK